MKTEKNSKPDMKKALIALERLGNKVKTPGTYLDMRKVLKIGNELIGSSASRESKRIPTPACRPTPEDIGRRKHTTRVARGCSGFSHPHFLTHSND